MRRGGRRRDRLEPGVPHVADIGLPGRCGLTRRLASRFSFSAIPAGAHCGEPSPADRNGGPAFRFQHRSGRGLLFCLIAGLLALAGCTSTPAVQRTEADRAPVPAGELDALLTRVFAQEHIPGGAAVVLRGHRIVAHGVAGVRKLGAEQPIRPDDQFEICSCAKAMTATLLARYVDAGAVRWDDSVAAVFGNSMPKLDPAWNGVTLRELMQHRAGLRDHFILLAQVAGDRSLTPEQARHALVARLLSRPPDSAPGKRFAYESAGYLILGAAIERLGGKPWETLMRERLFEPLGLKSAGFGPPGTPGKIDEPWGHGPRWWWYLPLPGSTAIPQDPGSRYADFPAAAGPAGLVHLSMGDWAKFVALHLRGDPANPHREVALLRPDTFALLHAAGSPGGYAGGWFTGTRPWAKGSRPNDTGRVFFHEGDNDRWNCVVWVAPEIDLAVLVACNRTGASRSIDRIAGQLATTYAASAATLSDTDAP